MPQYHKRTQGDCPGSQMPQSFLEFLKSSLPDFYWMITFWTFPCSPYVKCQTGKSLVCVRMHRAEAEQTHAINGIWRKWPSPWSLIGVSLPERVKIQEHNQKRPKLAMVPHTFNPRIASINSRPAWFTYIVRPYHKRKKKRKKGKDVNKFKWIWKVWRLATNHCSSVVHRGKHITLRTRRLLVVVDRQAEHHLSGGSNTAEKSFFQP